MIIFFYCLVLLTWFRIKANVQLTVYIATLNISVISWQSVLLVEETTVPGENHDLSQVTDKLLSHNIVLSTSRHEVFVVICTHCTGKSNYHATMMAPSIK
jgi:hypothetical protein